jgi:hypothetical protein
MHIRIHATAHTPDIARAEDRTVSEQKGCRGGQPFRFAWCPNGLRKGRVVGGAVVDRGHPFPQALDIVLTTSEKEDVRPIPGKPNACPVIRACYSALPALTPFSRRWCLVQNHDDVLSRNWCPVEEPSREL